MGPPALGPLHASPGDAGVDALLDDRALELGEYAKHLEQRPSGRRGRVDGLPFEIKVAPRAVQLPEKADEVRSCGG